MTRETKLKVGASVLLVLAGVIGIRSVMSFFGGPASKIHYPYVCSKCGAVMDVSELRANDGRNWRIPPKAPSDSIVICLGCNEGWAYPVIKCPRCGTQYMLHVVKDPRCPKCFPEVAEMARKAGRKLIYEPGK
jgi:hypothetical protein